MKLADKQIKVFNLIQASNPDLKLFTYCDADTLDTFYNAMYSERTLAPIIDKMTPQTIGNTINSLFHMKWDNLIDGYVSAIERLLTFGTKETVTENTGSEGNSTDTTTNTVSAYNDDEFTNDNKSEEKTTNKSDVKRTRTTDRSSARNVNIIWNYLLRTNVIYNIIDDVNSVITLSIYESEDD